MQEKKKKSFSEKMKAINPWGVVALFFLFFNLAAGGYYFYMNMEVKKVTKILESKNKTLLEKKRTLNKVKEDDGYKRYQAAKVVKESADMMNRLENTQYLIELLNRLYELDESDDTLLLDGVEISNTAIGLKGSASALKSIYREGGVIDSFQELEFVEKIDIPGYTDGGNGITFDLSANIKSYDRE